MRHFPKKKNRELRIGMFTAKKDQDKKEDAGDDDNTQVDKEVNKEVEDTKQEEVATRDVAPVMEDPATE